MKKLYKNIYYSFVICSILFVLITTNYLNLNDIIFSANQTDAISYSEIAKIAPEFPKDSNVIIQHVAQRFLIHYIVGSIADFVNINFFEIYKIVNFIFVLLYIYVIFFLSKTLKLDLKESILFFSILFFNPYIVRYHLFNPVQAHDMLFFSFGLLFTYSVICKKYVSNIIVTLVSVFLRQTSIALFIGSSVNLLINKKIKLFFLLLIVYLSISALTIYLGKKISLNTFPSHLMYAIFYYDFNQIEKLIKFILLGLFPFVPLAILIWGKLNSFYYYNAFILFLVCAMMIGQPILGGPDGSLNNVGRIANLCYPILTVLVFYVFDFKRFVNFKFLFYSFIIFMFFWSLHPTFSIFDFFGIFRFYNY
jgi:hypothetical protein